jgi:hypothetical protein
MNVVKIVIDEGYASHKPQWNALTLLLNNHENSVSLQSRFYNLGGSRALFYN